MNTSVGNTSSTVTLIGISIATVLVLSCYRRMGRYILTCCIKYGMNPSDPAVGQILPERTASAASSALVQDGMATGMFQHKSILIIGGTRGVGYGLAVALAQAGAAAPLRITLVGRNAQTGQRAVATIRQQLQQTTQEARTAGTTTERGTSTHIEYLQGDLGSAASTQVLIARLQQPQQEHKQRYDYLIVTAAVLTAPPYRNPVPLNHDGIEKCFGIGVVGRFLLYRQAHTFMTSTSTKTNTTTTLNSQSQSPLYSSPLIWNVCAAGDGKAGFDRTLVRALATPIHFHNDANYAIGNELMLRQFVLHPEPNTASSSIPIITSHPGFIATELLHDQGWLVALLVPILCHFIGTDVYESGRRELAKLCAISQTLATVPSPPLPLRGLTMVDHYGIGRTINAGMEHDMAKHGAWLWKLLLKIEEGEDIQKYQD